MPAPHRYRGRCAATVENDDVRVTVLEEGGHIAEMFDKRSGINPLWTPPWPSIEPSTYAPSAHPEYGTSSEAALLAGLMGHNLCVDIFGGPSEEEAAAGVTPHGEASIVRYDIDADRDRHSIAMQARLPLAQLQIDRRLVLRGRVLTISEAVENLTACDRPIGWTQHVTLGPPFLADGTRVHLTADRSLVYPHPFGPVEHLVRGAEFAWPHAPRPDGGTADLRVYPLAAVSSVYTAHHLDPRLEDASFVAYSASVGMAFGYAWRRGDFPWLGLWEENRARTNPPWNGETRTWGLEFGVSPIPESRREMIERGRTFDTPGWRWIPARRRVEVAYRAVLRPAASMPASLE